jgi:hypothetical protein
MQLVPITTKVVSSNPASSWRGVLDTTLCDQVSQLIATGRWFSANTPVSSTNKTDRAMTLRGRTVIKALFLTFFHVQFHPQHILLNLYYFFNT